MQVLSRRYRWCCPCTVREEPLGLLVSTCSVAARAWPSTIAMLTLTPSGTSSKTQSTASPKASAASSSPASQAKWPASQAAAISSASQKPPAATRSSAPASAVSRRPATLSRGKPWATASRRARSMPVSSFPGARRCSRSVRGRVFLCRRVWVDIWRSAGAGRWGVCRVSL